MPGPVLARALVYDFWSFKVKWLIIGVHDIRDMTYQCMKVWIRQFPDSQTALLLKCDFMVTLIELGSGVSE